MTSLNRTLSRAYKQLLGYEKFWDISSVEKTLISSAEKKGKKKGKKKGIEEGLAEGKNRNRERDILYCFQCEKARSFL